MALRATRPASVNCRPDIQPRRSRSSGGRGESVRSESSGPAVFAEAEAEPALGQHVRFGGVQAAPGECREVTVATVFSHQFGGAPQPDRWRVGPGQRSQRCEQRATEHVEFVERLQQRISDRRTLVVRRHRIDARGCPIGTSGEDVVAADGRDARLVDATDQRRIEHAERGGDQ